MKETAKRLRAVLVVLGIAAIVASVALDLRLRRQNEARGWSALTEAHYDNVRASRDWLNDIVNDVRTSMSLEVSTRDDLEALLRETEAVDDPGALLERTSRHRLVSTRLSTMSFRGGGNGYALLARDRVVAMDWSVVPKGKLPEGALRDEPWLALPGSPLAKMLGTRKGDADRRAAWLIVAISKRDGAGSIAHVAFSFDPMRFANVFARSMGETYALGSDGRFASTPLRMDELVRDGIVDPSFDDIEAREVGRLIDPQTKRRERGPLTVAAEGLAAGRSGRRVGYRSFRGVEVAGIWSWDEKFGYGVVTEMPTSDLDDGRLARTGDTMTAVGVLSGLALMIAALLVRRGESPSPARVDVKPSDDAQD